MKKLTSSMYYRLGFENQWIDFFIESLLITDLYWNILILYELI